MPTGAATAFGTLFGTVVNGESPHPPHPMTDRGAEDFDLLLFPSLTLLAQGPQVSRASECKKTHKEATNRTNSFLKSPHTKPCASIQGHQSIGTMMMHNMPSRACWKRPHPASPHRRRCVETRNPKFETHFFFSLERARSRLCRGSGAEIRDGDAKPNSKF